MNPETIFYRIVLHKKSDEKLKEFFNYELGPYPVSPSSYPWRKIFFHWRWLSSLPGCVKEWSNIPINPNLTLTIQNDTTTEMRQVWCLMTTQKTWPTKRLRLSKNHTTPMVILTKLMVNDRSEAWRWRLGKEI